MSERTVGQMSFADQLVADVARGNATLERIDALVNWAAVKKLLSPLRSNPMGAPGYPSLALFKALLLQTWYGLSDEALEEALGDRLSSAELERTGARPQRIPIGSRQLMLLPEPHQTNCGQIERPKE